MHQFDSIHPIAQAGGTTCTIAPASDWHETAEAKTILAALVALQAVALDLGRLDDAAHDHVTREARTILGCLESKRIDVGLAFDFAWEVRPSHGCTAVEALWNALAELRRRALAAQLADEALGDPAAGTLTRAEADASFERLDELDRDAPGLSAAVVAAMCAGSCDLARAA